MKQIKVNIDKSKLSFEFDQSKITISDILCLQSTVNDFVAVLKTKVEDMGIEVDNNFLKKTTLNKLNLYEKAEY